MEEDRARCKQIFESKRPSKILRSISIFEIFLIESEDRLESRHIFSSDQQRRKFFEFSLLVSEESAFVDVLHVLNAQRLQLQPLGNYICHRAGPHT